MRLALAVIIMCANFVSVSAYASPPRQCERLDLTISGGPMASVPVSILRTGPTPILQVGSERFGMRADGSCYDRLPATGGPCIVNLPVIRGGRQVAVLQSGTRMVNIRPTRVDGSVDMNQPYYQTIVTEMNSTPRFEVFARHNGEMIGQMVAMNMGALPGSVSASTAGRVDLRDNSVVLSNCQQVKVVNTAAAARGGSGNVTRGTRSAN